MGSLGVESISRGATDTNSPKLKMASKAGKQKDKRDSLPRSVSSMSDESNEVAMSASSKSSSSVVSSSMKTSSASFELEMATGDLALPGFLSLKELNALLEKYI